MNAHLSKKNLTLKILFSLLCITAVHAETFEQATVSQPATATEAQNQQTKEVDAEMLRAGRHALQLGKEGLWGYMYNWQTLEYEPNGFFEGLTYQLHLAPEECYFNEYGMFPKELENNEQEKNNARVRVKGSFDKFPIKAVQSPAQEAWKAICCADEHDANNELPIKLKDGSLTQCKVWQYRASNRKAIECEFLTTRAALVATITRKNIKPVTQEKHR